MRLPEDVLAKIYSANFERLAGGEPKPLDRKLAIEECRRIAAGVSALGGDPAAVLEAADRITGC